jgi:hypothetical protein
MLKRNAIRGKFTLAHQRPTLCLYFTHKHNIHIHTFKSYAHKHYAIPMYSPMYAPCKYSKATPSITMFMFIYTYPYLNIEQPFKHHVQLWTTQMNTPPCATPPHHKMKIIQKLLTQALCKYSKAEGEGSMFKSWRGVEYVCATLCKKYFRHMGVVSNPFPLPSIIHTGTAYPLSIPSPGTCFAIPCNSLCIIRLVCIWVCVLSFVTAQIWALFWWWI